MWFKPLPRCLAERRSSVRHTRTMHVVGRREAVDDEYVKPLPPFCTRLRDRGTRRRHASRLPRPNNRATYITVAPLRASPGDRTRKGATRNRFRWRLTHWDSQRRTCQESQRVEGRGPRCTKLVSWVLCGSIAAPEGGGEMGRWRPKGDPRLWPREVQHTRDTLHRVQRRGCIAAVESGPQGGQGRVA